MSLQMMHLRLNAALTHDLAVNSELSLQDYVVLVALTAEAEGRLRLFELGQLLGWEKSRISHQVSRMVERGQVKKYECRSDRRGQFVEVTPSGRAAIEAAAPSHVEAVRRLFVDSLSREQLQQVAEVAETVLQAVKEETARTCPNLEGELEADKEASGDKERDEPG